VIRQSSISLLNNSSFLPPPDNTKLLEAHSL